MAWSSPIYVQSDRHGDKGYLEFHPDNFPVRNIDMIWLKQLTDNRLLATLKSFIIAYTSQHRNKIISGNGDSRNVGAAKKTCS